GVGEVQAGGLVGGAVEVLAPLGHDAVTSGRVILRQLRDRWPERGDGGERGKKDGAGGDSRGSTQHGVAHRILTLIVPSSARAGRVRTGDVRVAIRQCYARCGETGVSVRLESG